MSEDDAKRWDQIYRNAVMELARARVRGRIGDARALIRTRSRG
jgi:hypothetical protein